MATKKSKKKAAKSGRAATKKAASKRAATKKPTAKSRAKKSSAVGVHPVVHWEIQSRTPERLHSFYAEALGWKIDADNPMKYGMVASKGRGGINGGIGGTQEQDSRVVVYSSVPSIEDVLGRIESLGGRTRMPRTDIGPVIMALYEDPEGNVMGLIEG
jgi:predicted enzyme related to lactoylglutathione lyase